MAPLHCLFGRMYTSTLRRACVLVFMHKARFGLTSIPRFVLVLSPCLAFYVLGSSVATVCIGAPFSVLTAHLTLCAHFWTGSTLSIAILL